MATPINSPVTLTPLLKKGNRETRRLIVSQASANISGDIGKYCGAGILCAVPIGCHAYRIKNRSAG
jgi:hypothetical protein